MVFSRIATLFQRIKSPQTPEALKAQAVQEFCSVAHAPLPKAFTEEHAWLASFVGTIRRVEKERAQAMLLQAVDQGTLELANIDRCLHALRHGIVVETNADDVLKPARVVVARKAYTAFVVNAVCAHDWDIDGWHDKLQWFHAVLLQAWETGQPERVANVEYAQAMARKYSWARDELLEYRVSHLHASPTLDSMFEGPFGQSLNFITAVSGIALRMHLRTPCAAAVELHERAHAAWPKEMEQLESTLYVQAMLEGMVLADVAGLAQSMEMDDAGYSPYLQVFGETIHGVVRRMQNVTSEALALPELG